MFGIGGSELVVIVFVVLLLFGPTKIPEIARLVKRGYQEWTKVRSQVDTTISEIKQEIDLKADFEGMSPEIKPAPGNASRRRQLGVPDSDDYLSAEAAEQNPYPELAASEPDSKDPEG